MILLNKFLNQWKTDRKNSTKRWKDVDLVSIMQEN